MWCDRLTRDTLACRDPLAFALLAMRRVHVETDDKFVTYFPEDLTTLGAAAWGMKPYHHGQENQGPRTSDANVHPAYKMSGPGLDRRTRLPTTIFIAETKEQCQKLLRASAAERITALCSAMQYGVLRWLSLARIGSCARRTPMPSSMLPHPLHECAYAIHTCWVHAYETMRTTHHKYTCPCAMWT